MNPIRCGRCIAEDHAQCVGRITMGTPKAAYTWHCDCMCQTLGSQRKGDQGRPGGSGR